MPAHAATGADPAGSSHPAKPVEGGNSAEMEAGFAAVLRTVVLAKTKASVRMVAFKIFKPKETSLSVSQVFKNSAKKRDMTLSQYLRHIVRSEGWRSLLSRMVPAYVGNAASSAALFTTYASISPYPLLIEWRADDPPAMPTDSFLRVFANVFPYGFAAGLAHVCVALPLKTMLASHYAHEPFWMLFEPGHAGNLRPGKSVCSGGDTRAAGSRKLRQVAMVQPWRLMHEIAGTVLCARMWQHNMRISLVRDPLAFGAFFAAYEAVKGRAQVVSAEACKEASFVRHVEIFVSASTACVAGGSAGAAYSCVKVPITWVSDVTVSRWQPMASRAFARHLALSVFKHSLPNAGAFLAIELFMHYAGLVSPRSVGVIVNVVHDLM